MAGRIYIPKEVKDSIQEHITNSVRHAVDGFASASEDEDALSGHLGASLRSGVRTVRVNNIELGDETWRWSIDYAKFRGRGPNATEKILGADGIFQLSCDHGGRSERKSLLFQAKLDGEGGRKLVEQCIKLSTWREAAFVLSFGPDQFRAISLDTVLSARGATKAAASTDLAQYLSDPFLNCHVGDTELLYEARDRRLVWRAMNGEIVAANFAVRHRINLKVKAPPYGRPRNADRVVSPEELYKFRMQADADDILGIANHASPQNAKAAQRSLSVAYHPDAYAMYPLELRQILEARMTEINVAADHRKGED